MNTTSAQQKITVAIVVSMSAISLGLMPQATHAERRAFPTISPIHISPVQLNIPGSMRDDTDTQGSENSQSNTGNTVSTEQSDGENGADASSAGGAGGNGGNNGGTTAGNGGNGGDGGGAEQGGLVRAGNVVSNATALNMINAVIIRITR